MKELKEEIRTPTIFAMIYGKLEARTNNLRMYKILRQLGWKIKLTEFGRLI